MASFNKVILVGNLTRDPEVRYIPSGAAVAELGLAVSETYKNRDGEKVEQTCFVDVVVWQRQAETCGEYLSKGSPILVEGRLQQDRWQTKEGDTRTKIRVRADRVQFLSGRRDRDDARNSGSSGHDAQHETAPAPAPEPVPPPPSSGGSEPLEDDDNLPF